MDGWLVALGAVIYFGGGIVLLAKLWAMEDKVRGDKESYFGGPVTWVFSSWMVSIQ